MAEQELQLYRKIAISFVAGVIAVPGIVLMHPVHGHIIDPVLEFVRASVGRGLSAFLGRVFEMGGWRESFLDGFIACGCFLGGGVVLMLLGLLVRNFVAQALILTVFGAFFVYICLKFLEFRRLWQMAQRNKIQPFAIVLVIVFVTAAMMGVEELCTRKY